MEIHLTLPESKVLDGCALTVGTFDGVHRGHQLLVSRLRAEAAQFGVPAAGLTFVDMPICHFRPDICPRLLTLAQEKVGAFASTGLDHLFIVPFDGNLAAVTAGEFMARLKETLGLQLFVGGPDFALGKNREGDIAHLMQLGANLGFQVKALEEKLLESGTPISSTRTRGHVENGEMEAASQCLGREYALSGAVVPGQQLGRTIGVPTINLQPEERKCLPQNGVYAVRAQLEDNCELMPAVMNIGYRPTVDGKRLALEFHVLDRELGQAPQNATVHFVHRLRSEQRFHGLDALVAQIQKDKLQARELFGM